MMLIGTVLSLLLVGAVSQTCTSSPPSVQSCTGNLKCLYGSNQTCCNGDVQFVGKSYECDGSQWQVAMHDGCLFGCSASCPTNAPKNNDGCTVQKDVVCNYENSQAKCTGGKWLVTSACKTDADCASGTFCWGEICLFYSQAGEECGGFTLRPLKCDPSLPCIPPPATNPPIADLPGKCGCESDAECGAQAFCWNQQCIPYRQVGESCGGFTRLPLRCDKSLTCIPNPKQSTIPDLPGTCARAAPQKCPLTPPTTPGCSGDLQCPYGKNATCCNGVVQFQGRIFQCHDGQWIVAVADGCMFACDEQCPKDVPTPGKSCTFVTNKTCKYGKASARCVKGEWQVQVRPVYAGVEALRRKIPVSN